MILVPLFEVFAELFFAESIINNFIANFYHFFLSFLKIKLFIVIVLVFKKAYVYMKSEFNKKTMESAYILPVEDLYLEVMNNPLNK